MRKLSLEVLISCMNQTDVSLVEKSKITTDALMINQCDKDEELFIEKNGKSIRKFDVNQRGLSNSRNRAMECAKGDICLLCDDDEIMEKGYSDIILGAFEELPQADIIVFQIKNRRSKLRRKIYKLSKLECLRVGSWQIAFRREAVLNSGVRFDTLLGAGTEQGCGEENKFLLDCRKKGIRIYHYPQEIATVKQEVSTWFSGYNKDFFYQRGIVTGYILGMPLATAYAFYYVLGKYAMYKTDCTFVEAVKNILKGIWKSELKKVE